MKKISIILLTLLTTIITAVILTATPAYALENSNRWIENGDYNNYVWYSGTYNISDVDFADYEFYYFKTGDGWKQLAPSENDVIKLSQVNGETYVIRSIFLNDDLVVDGTQGMYGDNQVYIEFRYRKLDTEVIDPENPEPTPIWTTKEDGYTYFTGSYAQNTDTNILIDNIQYNILEYSVEDINVIENNIQWKLINIDPNNRLVVRNIAQGYSSRNVLLVVAGQTERNIAESTKALLPNGTVIDEVLRIRYKEIEVSDATTVEMLPETRTSIFNETMDMGTVRFIKSGFNLIVAINYDGLTYYLNYSFDFQQDMSVFENGFEVYYYTHENQKYILINQGNESMFTSSDIRKQTFVPYIIWNLSTNEFEKIERFNTYIHTRKESGNNAYAYFYVDEFVIEELLSVSLAFKYRYNKIFGGYTDWIEEYQILESGETNEVSALTWQGKVLSTTATATAIGSLIPAVRWPILAIGTAVMAIVGSQTDTNPFTVKNIEQIQIAEVDANLRKEMNEAYTKFNKDFTFDNNLKTFKLHLGQYDRVLTKGIDIDTNYSVQDEQKGVNIIQFTYRTDGKLYTILGDNINVVFNRGAGTDGADNEFDNNIVTTIIVFGSLALIIFGAIGTKAYSSPKKLVVYLLTVGILIAVVIGIYVAYDNQLFNNIITILRL